MELFMVMRFGGFNESAKNTLNMAFFRMAEYAPFALFAILFLGGAAELWAQGNAALPNEEPYGQSALWTELNKSQEMRQASSKICDLGKLALLMAAGAGIIMSFWTMFRAAREGTGSGRWRVAFIVLILSGALMAPGDLLRLIGMGWLINRGGMWSCILN